MTRAGLGAIPSWIGVCVTRPSARARIAAVTELRWIQARIGQRGRAKRECSGRNLGGKSGNRRCEVDAVRLYPALKTPPHLPWEAQQRFECHCASIAQQRSPAPGLWRRSVETGNHRYSCLAGRACSLSWQCARNCGSCPPLLRMSSTTGPSNGHRERIAVRKLRQKSGPRAAESTVPMMKGGTSPEFRLSFCLPDAQISHFSTRSDCPIPDKASWFGCGPPIEGGVEPRPQFPRLVILWKHRMKALRQFALTLAAILSLLAPAMACALPNAHLTPAERACCKQMRSECGNMAMPASHGCCQMEAPTTANWNAPVQISPANVLGDVTAIPILPSDILPRLQAAASGWERRPASLLPQSPPSAVSVLRI